MKKFLLAATILFCVMTAGCFQAKFDLIITGDGAVVRNWKLLGTAPFARHIEDLKARNEKAFPNLKVNPVAEGNLLGYEFSLEYPDIESFAKSSSEMYGAHSGKNNGISKHATWFFDEYDFDFYTATSQSNIPHEAEYMTQAALNNLVYEVTIQLPYPVEKCNADKIEDNGKFLQWNLAPLLIHSGEKHMNARFKIWHRDKIFVTALVELLLIASTIFFAVKARSEEFADIGKDLRFKRNIFAGLAVALALVSAYMILTPVTFTDADTISAALQ